jgi:hypothetical protein
MRFCRKDQAITHLGQTLNPDLCCSSYEREKDMLGPPAVPPEILARLTSAIFGKYTWRKTLRAFDHRLKTQHFEISDQDILKANADRTLRQPHETTKNENLDFQKKGTGPHQTT